MLISVSSSQRDNVAKIIERILDQHYPAHSYSITFDDLLNWDMWHIFLKIYSKFFCISLHYIKCIEYSKE